MYSVEVVTPPAAPPVAAAELRGRLRLNHVEEDALLAELLAGAVELWEADTGRPVLATVYRQYLSRWPLCPVVLGRGGVTAVTAVARYTDGAGTTEALSGYVVDLRTPPARVRLVGVPAAAETADGVPVSPVGYVEYAAGWAADAVPAVVRTAIMLLSAHWYERREAFHEGAELRDLPYGWRAVTSRYRTGLSGDWGQ